MPSNKRRSNGVVRTRMDVTILCIDSNYESVTQTAFTYRDRHVYPYLIRKGCSLILIRNSRLRRNDVLTEARKPSVVYLTGVGHGTPDTYTGNFRQPIFRIGNYSQVESRGKIVHFLSCQTAEKLGPDFVAKGCRAYFGYDADFTWDPKVADTFLECDSAIDRAFAAGLTAGQVHDRTKALFDKHIARFRANGNDYNAAMLEFNRDHLRCPASGSQWGDLNARLA